MVFDQITHSVAKTAESLGLPYDIAQSLFAQTLLGAGQMLLHSGKSPQELIQDVASKGGTTEAGLKVLSQHLQIFNNPISTPLTSTHHIQQSKPSQIQKKIGFIGFGKMAQAIASGISHPNIIIQSCTSKTSAEMPNIIATSDIIFLCMKPQQFLTIRWPKFPQKTLVISILAGTTLQTLKHTLHTESIVRAMPNTPVILKFGMTALCHSAKLTKQDKHTAQTLFETLGKVQEVQESQMNIVTAISGSGPAFLYLITDYLSQRYPVSEIAQAMIHAGEYPQKTDATQDIENVIAKTIQAATTRANELSVN